MKPKLLVTGASGFLGYHLLPHAAARYDVFGFYHKHLPGNTDAHLLHCDITNYTELGDLIEDIEPDAVIHAAALADTQVCEQNPSLSLEVNVGATENIAGICADLQIPLLFTSTDLVFDGTRGNYSEEDRKNPLSVYGAHKSMAEDRALAIYPNVCIARIPLMFGRPEAGKNFTTDLVKKLHSSEAIQLFYDEFRSICSADDISRGLLLLLEKKVSGVIHVAGSEKVSRYDFGMALAAEISCGGDCIRRVSQKDFPMSPPRPADVSLNISKALALGFQPKPMREKIHELFEKP